MVRAGEYRNYVTIQTVTTTQGSDGSSTESWATYISLWAKIKPLTGREYYSAQQTQAELTHNIFCRYTSGIVPNMRVLWGTRIFDIMEVVNVNERGEEIIMRCKERLA